MPMALFRISVSIAHLYWRNARVVQRGRHCFYHAIFGDVLPKFFVRQQGKGFYLTLKCFPLNVFSKTNHGTKSVRGRPY